MRVPRGKKPEGEVPTNPLGNIDRYPRIVNMWLPAPLALQALPVMAQLAVLRCRSLQPTSLAWRPAAAPCPVHKAHPAPQGVLSAARQRRRVQLAAAAQEPPQRQQDDWNLALAGGR